MTNNIKSGIYSIKFPITLYRYPNNTVLKIGHSGDMKNRFSVYNTSMIDEVDYVENNINFILHSQSQSNATKIL
jgi:hypothetical protein